MNKHSVLVYDEIFLEHKTGIGHPEAPQRLVAILQRLEENHIYPERAALSAGAEISKWIATVHTAEYIGRVKSAYRQGITHLDSPDVPVSERSYDAAVAAVGAALTAVDEVMDGKAKNAFCAVRPPGHHATADKALGFCIFNNAAIAARYIQGQYRLEKILIVDWDVHHGNGTESIFYDDPNVLYFSIHQYPFYPGTGSATDSGTGKGIGYNINVPLAAGAGDSEYIKVFNETLRPAAADFKPDFVLISAGFDACADDLLGGMKVTAEGFGELTRIVKNIAEQNCKGRLVSVLEGGYNLEKLADCTEAHIKILKE